MQVKVLSWNIWFDGYFNEISSFLKNFDADIIGLQEVVENDKTRDTIGLLKSLGYSHVYSTAFEVGEEKRRVGNAIFSKHSILSNSTHVLSEENSRNAVQADIEIGDKVIHVFSTHLLHTHQKPSEVQSSQAMSLMKLVPINNSIVMGDFNATPESETMQIVGKVLKNTDPALTPTWSVYPEGCPVCKPEKIDTRLDYIFTTPDFKVLASKVESLKGSDHLPISTIIEI